MTHPRIEPQSPGPLANILTIMLIVDHSYFCLSGLQFISQHKVPQSHSVLSLQDNDEFRFHGNARYYSTLLVLRESERQRERERERHLTHTHTHTHRVSISHSFIHFLVFITFFIRAYWRYGYRFRKYNRWVKYWMRPVAFDIVEVFMLLGVSRIITIINSLAWLFIVVTRNERGSTLL